MKHLKLFEESNFNYKKDDYVLINIDKIKRKELLIEYPNDLDGEKIEIKLQNFAQIFMVMLDRGYQPYRIKFYDNNTYDIEYEDIVRHLTQDEIDTYESMKTSIKYNL